jgi:hypothetical protein
VRLLQVATAAGGRNPGSMPQTTIARVSQQYPFQPLRTVLQVPRELRNRQLGLMLLKVRIQDAGCI